MKQNMKACLSESYFGPHFTYTFNEVAKLFNNHFLFYIQNQSCIDALFTLLFVKKVSNPLVICLQNQNIKNLINNFTTQNIKPQIVNKYFC